MATLTTDFIKIAQAGPTFDGRDIEEKWLQDLAATYDPRLYTAMLWPEHMRWYGNMGEVAELRAGPDEQGRYSLFARLKPNAWLLQYNAQGQKLFYSIEVDEHPTEPGKVYLGGLAVTDSPASLGMASTRFSAGSSGPRVYSNVEMSPLAPAAPEHPAAMPAADEEPAPAWFRRFFPSFFTSGNGDHGSPEKDAPMNESLTALETKYADLQERFSALEQRLSATEPPAGDPDPAPPAAADQFAVLTDQLAVLTDKFTAFTQAMESAVVPGTSVPPTTGPAGESPELL